MNECCVTRTTYILNTDGDRRDGVHRGPVPVQIFFWFHLACSYDFVLPPGEFSSYYLEPFIADSLSLIIKTPMQVNLSQLAIDARVPLRGYVIHDSHTSLSVEKPYTTSHLHHDHLYYISTILLVQLMLAEPFFQQEQHLNMRLSNLNLRRFSPTLA